MLDNEQKIQQLLSGGAQSPRTSVPMNRCFIRAQCNFLAKWGKIEELNTLLDKQSAVLQLESEEQKSLKIKAEAKARVLCLGEQILNQKTKIVS